MKIRGKSFHSTKFFLIQDEDNDAEGRPARYPKYSYPGFQWESLKQYKTIGTVPDIQKIVQTFANHISYSNTPQTNNKNPIEATKIEEKNLIINHVLGTKYCSAEDLIAYHDDKSKYLIKDSPIFLISLGERRELHLRPKGSQDSTECLIMEPGSMFVLGPRTNDTMQHSIVPTKDESLIQRYGEIGTRISLTMRSVSNMVDREEVINQIKDSRKKKEISRKKAEEVKKKEIKEERREIE